MKERVSVIYGKTPCLLVAPHGPDDTNTGELTIRTAQILQCNAVVNNGFSRSDIVDVDNDFADCNRIDHLLQDVVYDEFLKPIEKITNTILYGAKPNTFIVPSKKSMMIFYIHGTSDAVHKEVGEDISVILGTGIGTKKDSYTCKLWQKNLFIDAWRSDAYFTFGDVFEGKNKYAGRSSNNLNQYFRKYNLNNAVNSMQLEFPYCVRNDFTSLINTSLKLSRVIEKLLNSSFYDKSPISKFI